MCFVIKKNHYSYNGIDYIIIGSMDEYFNDASTGALPLARKIVLDTR